jgi:hypothetical protein
MPTGLRTPTYALQSWCATKQAGKEASAAASAASAPLPHAPSRPDEQVQPIVPQKSLSNVLSEGNSDASFAGHQPGVGPGVAPQHFRHGALVGRLLVPVCRPQPPPQGVSPSSPPYPTNLIPHTRARQRQHMHMRTQVPRARLLVLPRVLGPWRDTAHARAYISCRRMLQRMLWHTDTDVAQVVKARLGLAEQPAVQHKHLIACYRHHRPRASYTPPPSCLHIFPT